jgi:hypothetical protein
MENATRYVVGAIMSALIVLIGAWAFLPPTTRGAILMVLALVATISTVHGQVVADKGWRDLGRVVFNIMRALAVIATVICVIYYGKAPAANVWNFVQGILSGIWDFIGSVFNL